MNYSRNVADKIIYLFQRHGEELYFGEEVTQTQHAFQCLHLATMLSDDADIHLAAFVHDIGHLCEEENLSNGMVGYGIMNHESEGARFLMEMGFSQRICNLVENHVAAKRYLISLDDEYYDNLSEASKKTLEFQGGKMSKQEMQQFIKLTDFNNYILLRKCDDLGKSLLKKEENWKLIRDMIEKHIKNQLFLKSIS